MRTAGAAAILVLAMRMAVPAPSPATAAEGEVPPAAEVLARHLEAVGGREAVARHRSYHFSGTMEMPGQGIEGRLDLYAAAPNRYLLVVDVPGVGNISTGYDGKVGWMIQPLTGPMLLDAEALEQIRDEATFAAVLQGAGRYREAENLGRVEMDGKSCWKLRLVYPSGRTVYEYYDAGTYLPVASEGRQVTPLGTLQVVTHIEENRELDGVVYPTVTRLSAMGMEQVTRITDAEFNRVDPEVFELPPAIRTLADSVPTDPPGYEPPAALAGLPRRETMEGEAASAVLNRMHGDKGVSPEESFIAFYGERPREAVIYVSFFADSTVAAATARRMAERIASGAGPFESLRWERRNEVPLWSCTGLGRDHLFFARADGLYWLEADPAVGEAVFTAFLDSLDAR